MSFRGDALWNNPISSGSLRNAGASLTGQQLNRNPSQTNTLAQTQYQQSQQPQYNQTQQPQGYGGATDYVEADNTDYDIYNKAISVSSPRLAGTEGDENPGIVRKKVVRRVEVPFTRQVKVPTQTTQLVPTTVEQRIPVKKLVAVPGYKFVDEEYTEYEEREQIREKEVWVKKIIPERYIEKVPVHRVRQVQKPTTVIKEIETYETVQVPTTKKVTVEGYRVDQVQDSKVVEVEEYQDYELRPHAIGDPRISKTEELGRLPNSRLSRNIGHQVFNPAHPQLHYLDEDDQPDSSVPRNTSVNTLRGSQPLSSTNNPTSPSSTYQPSRSSPLSSTQSQQQQPSYNNSFYRPSSPTSQNLNIHGTSSLAASTQQYGAFLGTSNAPLNDPRSLPAAGGYRKPAEKNNDFDHNDVLSSLGLAVDDTHTRHTDGTGVTVTKVTRGGPAARAGIQPHDIVTGVNGVPSSTVDEFNSLLNKTSGPTQFTINRDGRRNITLSLYR